MVSSRSELLQSFDTRFETVFLLSSESLTLTENDKVFKIFYFIFCVVQTDQLELK